MPHPHPCPTFSKIAVLLHRTHTCTHIRAGAS